MKQNTKYLVNIVLISAVIFSGLLAFLILPKNEISASERRRLKAMPRLSIDTVFAANGTESFMDGFERYAKDQFPLRDGLRRLNALSGRYLLGKKEVDGYYLTHGHIAKIDDGLHDADLAWSVDRINCILSRYPEIGHAYMAVIPDKTCYLAESAGYPYAPLDEVTAALESSLSGQVEFLTVDDLLSADSYYRTDSHWRQEVLPPVAERLLISMHRPYAAEYSLAEDSYPFYGVYYGQAAMPARADAIRYLTWPGMDAVTASCYDTGKAEEIPLYDMEKLSGMDPYEMFLSGSKALITLENPAGEKGELIIFRDSFGSSLAPLLACGYEKVTLVDIRYISPSMLERFISFDGADVLFLYSSSLLNNSIGQFIK